MTIQVSKFPLSPIPSMPNFISSSPSNSFTPLGIICLPITRLRSLSLSLSSSLQPSIPITDSSQQHSFRVNYLINSCGLSQEEAFVATKHVKFNTPEKPDIVLSCFKNYGFPDTNISRIVKKYPQILTRNFAKTISPKLDYLYSKGISVPELVEIITAEPMILRVSLSNFIVPCFDMLKDVAKSDDEVIQTVKKFPLLLANKPEWDYVEILREVGVSDSNILLFLTSRRRVTMPTDENFRKILEEVKKLGFNPSSSRFIWALRKLTSTRKSTWEEKVDVFQKWGWSKDQVLMAFQKCPKFMDKSEHKINRTMDFLVNKMGWESSDIACRPAMICLSLEKRIIPRGLVHQVMVEKGLFINRRRMLSLATLLCFREEQFLSKISEICEDQAPEFVQLYHEIIDIMQGNREFDSIQNHSIQELLSDVSCSEIIRLCLPYLSGSD